MRREDEDPFADGPIRPRPQLLILDLDILLANGREIRTQAFKEALARMALEHGLEAGSNFESGEASEDEAIEQYIQALAGRLGEDDLDRLLEVVQEAKLEQIQAGMAELEPGMIGVLRSLRERGTRVAVYCADSRDCMLGFIDYFELDPYIEWSVCAADYATGDADQAFLDILENLEVLRSEAIFLSARPERLQAAFQAGVVCLVCLWGDALQGGQEVEGALSQPLEILDWLATSG